jgi:hypothetical protein
MYRLCPMTWLVDERSVKTDSLQGSKGSILPQTPRWLRYLRLSPFTPGTTKMIRYRPLLEPERESDLLHILNMDLDTPASSPREYMKKWSERRLSDLRLSVVDPKTCSLALSLRAGVRLLHSRSREACFNSTTIRHHRLAART